MRTWKQLKTPAKKWRRVKDMSRKWWYRARYPFSQAWYWVRTHVWNRYHIVNCKSPQNGYRWGWCDRDWLMFCACFNILVDFVEKESPRVGLDDADDRDVEIRNLYHWWTQGRANAHASARKLLHGIPAKEDKGDSLESLMDAVGANTPEWKTWREASAALDARDDEMLARLMAVRQSLWT